MNTAKRKRLVSAGWRVGTASEFLGLSGEEAQVVEMKLALGESLKRHRRRKRLTQGELARRLGSSQSRVAKLEAGGPGVSLDLLFRALFAAGLSREQIAREIRRPMHLVPA
jgi:DNA-binding XRE family transcriptional regulator